MADDAHSQYLRDLGFLLREAAEEARREAKGAKPDDANFQKGRQMAYYEVLSLMQQQAVGFDLPLSDLALDGFHLEDLLAP